MTNRKKRLPKNEDETLWLTNLEFSGRSEKAFVKFHLISTAETLATLRRNSGISQEKLAELAQISVSTVKFIEQKKRVPSLALLLKVLFVLDKEAKILK